MANHLNWSGAFAGAGNALQQGVQVHANMDLEQMRADRAENLARFSLNKQLEHEDWRAKLEDTRQRDIADRTMANEKERDAAAGDRQDKSLASSESRAAEHERAMFKLAIGAQAAAEGRQTAALTAAQKAQRDRDIQGNRRDMNNAAMTFDNQRRQLSAAIAAETAKNASIAYISDPDKRREAMAKDPAIGDLLRQQAELENTRTLVLNNYTLQAHELGDPNFPGQKAPPPNTAPSDPSIPSLDGSEAPSADTSGAPQLSGMRPPVKSAVGPLLKPPTGIPSLMPGISGGPPDSSALPLGSPQPASFGGIPSLMPGS